MEIYIKRGLLDNLKKHLKKKEISFIVGPRQAGKTTLLKILERELKIENKKTVFFNLDIEYDKTFFSSQSFLLKKIELEIGKKEGFVFIDEIQRKENAGVFLKGLYDMNLPYKFIVSGSGSVELKEKLHESLSGRKRIFELSTLTFEEFVNFKTEYKYENNLKKFFKIEKTKSLEFLEEYLNFGGYPRIALEDELSEKLLLISEIYQSYIEKDTSYLLKVHKIEEFGRLVKLMAAETGNIIKLTELSSELGISTKTLKDYLWYLEKTFIISKVYPFFKNIRKELSKSTIFYFYDLGLRNFSSENFGNLKDYGFVFQNFIYNILREKLKNSSDRIYFWRTKDKAEIDFVIEKGKIIIPCEVKYKHLKSPLITRAMRSFIEKYKVNKAIIFNLSLKEKIKIENTEILFLPYYESLFDIL